MGSLDFWSVEFEKIGWFIPPYVTMGKMEEILRGSIKNQNGLTQAELEVILADIYSPFNMANLYVEKYSTTPFVKDYLKILGDGLEAHFLGLHYAAVATLIPVVEGVSRRLAEKRNVEHKYIKQTTVNLCESCKIEVNSRKLGAYKEVESMIDSFEQFATKKLYAGSSQYPHDDNTNRHGIHMLRMLTQTTERQLTSIKQLQPLIHFVFCLQLIQDYRGFQQKEVRPA